MFKHWLFLSLYNQNLAFFDGLVLLSSVLTIPHPHLVQHNPYIRAKRNFVELNIKFTARFSKRKTLQGFQVRLKISVFGSGRCQNICF